MASSSTRANSSGSSTIQNSGSEGGDLQHVMDQRKRKRMLSNRESARRSRIRKQNHVDDLTAQACELTKENNQILTSMNMASQLYLNIEAENSILRAQMAELSQRLESLNGIINYMTSTNTTIFQTDNQDTPIQEYDSFMINNPWSSSLYLNHPIMASTDVFMY
ncbi:bZIP transcription factor 11-like [Corylus avellana]|uniref:bZIP transcription factor 11-like n=1 Tax=Corylus avellana TaxID=13451 RepID=UPI001E21050C|nr:bZIP transcription factor 11-like [Corylus avellana]